uniref:DUF2992 family protein n=1 Tax=Strongyloides stercoralis TaxID=6248 RepID=A0A0K0EEQ1_STRER
MNDYLYKLKFSFEYDNNGRFTGCVVIHCTNYVAEQIKRDFAGCCIDGKLLSFEIIHSPTGIHPKFIKAVETIFKHSNIDKPITKTIKKRSTNNNNSKRFKIRRDKKSKISKHQLDLELEEYFKRAK